MSSLVPGYMTVSSTVIPAAVGVRSTCGVEGRPEGEGRKEEIEISTSEHQVKLRRLTHQGEA